MKNSIKVLFALFIAVGLSSCLKDNSYEPYDGQAMLEKEAPILKEYVETTEGLEDAILDPTTGIWYQIIEEGIGPEEEEGFYEYLVNEKGEVTEAPIVTVKYNGKLVPGGIEFGKNHKDEGDDLSLGDIYVRGWIIGFLPETLTDEKGKEHEIGGLTELGLQQGSKIRLVIPSPYAYQNQSQSGIPANSPLDFTIEVLKVVAPTSTQ